MEIVIELPQDINKLCRTCMDVVKLETKKDIFDDEDLNLQFMFKTVTGIEISPQDGLPKYLCGECVKKLELSYTFKRQCQDTYMNLKGFLNNTEDLKAEVIYEKSDYINAFKCDVCLKAFSSQYLLSRHEIEHFSEKSLTQRFIDNHNVSNDNLDSTNAFVNGDIVDLITLRKYEENENLIETTIEVNDSNDNKTCDICNREFPNSLSLTLHFINHALIAEGDTDPDIYQQYFFCDHCGETFQSKEDLTLHLSTCEDNKNNYKCNKCEAEFNRDIQLVRHDEQEHKLIDNISWNEVLLKPIEKTEFQCPICNETFTSKHALTIHSVKHVLKQITCRICKKTFCSQIACNNHLKTHPNYKHVCRRCGRCLGSRHALKTHIMGVHSTASNYTCTICSKKFKTPSRLYIHKLIHQKEKKYDCTKCSYKTNNVGDMKVHNRIHTLERPYKCNFVNCNRTFKTSSHLNEHIQRHLQIKKYQCEQCKMVFGHHHSLKMHIMVHTGEKPFNCEVCGLRFRRKHHLKNHMKQHEGQAVDDANYETITINF